VPDQNNRGIKQTLAYTAIPKEQRYWNQSILKMCFHSFKKKAQEFNKMNSAKPSYHIRKESCQSQSLMRDEDL